MKVIERRCDAFPLTFENGGMTSLSYPPIRGEDFLYNRVGRKGGMVTISFARGKHMQFAVVLVIYDII